MAMSGGYGPADEKESIATIQAALDAGINVLDTGDYYGMGHNEMLIRDAIRGRRDQAVIIVKFGALRGPDGAWLGVDTRPAAVRNFLAYTLRRLGTDHIDVYQPGRVDPSVPIEETAGTIRDLIQAGYVRHLGLSEASAETVRRAHAVQPVVELQIEYSLMSRGIEAEILPAMRELGVGVTAYGVFSRGLIGGTAAKAPGFRAALPRFQGANLAQNLSLVESLAAVAGELGVKPAQLALAWVLARGDDIVPLVGMRTRAHLADALAAVEVRLTSEQLARVEAAVPAEAVAGARYQAEQMARLDSEKR
jgi:aryl-alcohol dehydrogenase-like predicted oxidoreductase